MLYAARCRLHPIRCGLWAVACDDASQLGIGLSFPCAIVTSYLACPCAYDQGCVSELRLVVLWQTNLRFFDWSTDVTTSAL